MIVEMSGMSLVALSLVARLMIRRRMEDHWFVVGVRIADTIFLMVGLTLVGMVNASLTDPFAKYGEAFPTMGNSGLREEEILANILFFMLPLISLGLKRIFKEMFQEIGALLGTPQH
jgi:hypothetical protein